jgi:hypothetical protein
MSRSEDKTCRELIEPALQAASWAREQLVKLQETALAVHYASAHSIPKT